MKIGAGMPMHARRSNVAECSDGERTKRRAGVLLPLAVASATALLAITLITTPASGQLHTDRILRTSGDVRLTFTPRSNVCGDGGPIIRVTGPDGQARVHFRDGRTRINSSNTDEWTSECISGPVRVTLTVASGRVRDVRTYVGGSWRNSDRVTADLGRVAAPTAADVLLALAKRSHDSAHALLFAATLADSSNVDQELLEMARDPTIRIEVRRAAVLWASLSASDVASSGLREIIDSEDDFEVRKHAVFALSQMPRDQAVPALIDIVRKRGDRRIVKQAVFWLGQTNDPRAIALFEELLLTRK